MNRAAILGAAEAWVFAGAIGTATIAAVASIVTAWLARQAKKNTEPNGGSSPHDIVVGELNALTTALQIMDERSVVEQRTAHDVHRRLLDGQDRLQARQDELAAMVDRAHRRIDTLADLADHIVELVERYHQTGG